MTVALLAIATFGVGALWREAAWRWTIGGTVAQIRARRAATLAAPLEPPLDTRGPVVDLEAMRRRRRAFDARIGWRS